MKAIWIALNTTTLEPTVANIIEMSIALQRNGKIEKRFDWKIKPIWHNNDQMFGKQSEDEFLAGYHQWTKDPKHKLEECGAHNAVFFYNADTLKYLGIEAHHLLMSSREYPGDVLYELVCELEKEEVAKKWVLTGHNAPFLAEVFLAWSRRLNKELYYRIQTLVEFRKPLDTIPFFKVAAAFDPSFAPKGFGLKEIGESLGQTVSLDSKSKLDVLLNICGQVTSGGVRSGQEAVEQNLPSQVV